MTPDALQTGGGAPAAKTSRLSSAIRRLGQWRSNNRALLHWFGIAASGLIVAVSLFILAHAFATVRLADLRAALLALEARQIALSIALTGLSYFALTGYDVLALKQLALRVRYRRAALASFTSYAVAFTLGFPLITGGTVRYWIYSSAGLSAGRVASLTLIAGVTFWLGMAVLVGVALVVEPASLAALTHLRAAANLALGLAILAAVAAYLVWVGIGHRSTRIEGLTLELPGVWLSLGQIALSMVDLCSAAGALYVLLPRGHTMAFLDFAATYVLAALLGIASNAPGGIGAFEVTILKSVAVTSQEGLLASLLLYRLIYYLGPFVLALALLGAHEGMRRWGALRAAMRGGDSADDETG